MTSASPEILDGASLLATPPRARFAYVSLAGAQAPGARLAEASIRFADARGAELPGAVLDGALLEHVDLVRADLRGASLRGATLRDCNLDAAVLDRADLTDARLLRCTLDDASLRGALLADATTVGCSFAGASFEGAREFATCRDLVVEVLRRNVRDAEELAIVGAVALDRRRCYDEWQSSLTPALLERALEAFAAYPESGVAEALRA